MWRLFIVALVWFVPALALAAGKDEALTESGDESDAARFTNTIILQGLNKVTGHISRLEGAVGTLMRFGNLEIVTRRCWKSSPDDRPENAALLQISELKPGEPPQQIFLGWMFSSSPGLSGLEHPVYDITVLSCDDRDEQEQLEKPPEKKPDAKKPAEKNKL